MVKKAILLGILLVIFSGIIIARIFIDRSRNAVGQLQIDATPSSQVFINNILEGKTPFNEQYKVGEYQIKLIPEGSTTEKAPSEMMVKVGNQTLTYVNRELGSSDVLTAGEIFTVSLMDKKPKQPNLGEIHVVSEPIGAIVYLDNDEKGVAPLDLLDVAEGHHELSVFMPGMKRRTKKLNVKGGHRVSAEFKLAVDEKTQIPTATDEADLDSESATDSAAPSKSPEKKADGTVTIDETPTGFLRVREDATTSASESAQVKPGDTFTILDEKNGWYKIEYETDKEGWISGTYATAN